MTRKCWSTCTYSFEFRPSARQETPHANGCWWMAGGLAPYCPSFDFNGCFDKQSLAICLAHNLKLFFFKVEQQCTARTTSSVGCQHLSKKAEVPEPCAVLQESCSPAFSLQKNNLDVITTLVFATVRFKRLLYRRSYLLCSMCDIDGIHV